MVEENRARSQVIGNPQAPYLTALSRQGAFFTNSYGVAHPSQPNYLALFSGSTHGVTSDSCPETFGGGNLAAQLLSAQLSFTGYAEGLPHPGGLDCSAGAYARKHAPWTDFPALPARAVGRPWSQWPTSFASLPTVSFVIPDLEHDMHDGSIGQGDQWLQAHLASYLAWAKSHNSLLVVTWDEDDDTPVNRIPTLVLGAHVRPGRYAEPVDHYRMLRTLESFYGLPPIGEAARRTPITDIWTH